MLPRKPRLLLALVLCPSFACADESRPEDSAQPLAASAGQAAPSAGDLAALGRGNRAFAFDLYHQIAAESAGENLVFSPFSISSALAMTYAGARGATADEMKSALHFDLPQPALHATFSDVNARLSLLTPNGVAWRVNVDNAVWAQQGEPFEQSYLDVLSASYHTAPTTVDFRNAPQAARATINAHVSKNTNGLVPELLPPALITPATQLVLTNSVYLEARWSTPFDARLTRAAPFTKLDGSTVSAQLMNASLSLPFFAGSGFRAVALPYGRVYHVTDGRIFDPNNPPVDGFEGLTFVAVLPDPGKLAALEADLSQAWFDALRGQLASTEVTLRLPRFETRAKTSLPKVLRDLGMRTAFGSNADFTGISRSGLSLSDVVHEAVIRVTEAGTVAASGTAVGGARSARPVQERELVSFDRAFLYAILDERSGQILFLGRVTDPTAK